MKKIKSDILWNYFSFGFLALCGLLLNLIIGTFYDETILGFFNQVTVIYIIFSVGSAGINFSVLRSIASDKKEVSENIIGALIPTIFMSILTIVILFILAKPFSTILEGPLLNMGFIY